MNITLDQLAAIVPTTARASLASFVEPLNRCFEKWGVSTPLQVAAFLGVFTHECGGFTRMAENLNYSAQGLANTWDRYSATGKRGGPPNALANRLNRNPQAIANNVYANRNGNGPEASGDGWRYRGAGVPQLTGKSNFQAYADATGIDAVGNPDQLRTAAGGVDPAGWYWYANGLSAYADKGDFDGVCDIVNKGRKTAAFGDAIGFAERKKTYDLARKVLSV